MKAVSFAKLFYTAIFVLSVGCGGQGSGNAPSNEEVSPPVVDDGTNQNYMSYRQVDETPNGWTAALDMSETVETVELANGWTVEVAHE